MSMEPTTDKTPTDKPTRSRWLFGVKQASFSRQLALTFATGMIVLALSASYATYTLTSKFLRDRLMEEGLQATRIFSEQSVLALLYHSPENAEEFAIMTMALPDVLGVGLYADDQTPLLELGDIFETDDEIEPLVQAPTVAALEFEDDQTWHYMAPVYSRVQNDVDASPFMLIAPEPEVLGYVRVVMSKQALNKMMHQVLQSNFLVSIILATLLLFVLLAITSRLIRPLDSLAEIMRRAEHEDTFIRAEIYGPKDIANMQQAFNKMVDVLEKREADLLTARDMALESARVKGQFAANVTHELRTPLNGIIGMLQLLDVPELQEKYRSFVMTAQNSAESLLTLINDILDFSKIDAGKAVAQVEQFSLYDLIQETTGLLSVQAEKKEIYLCCNVNPKIPEYLRGESNRIRQVLFNLIGNAIKFTKTGGVILEVKPESEDEASADSDASTLVLEFSVIDTGIGIDEDAQRRIFEPFSQADGSTSRNYGGTGLGLTISRQLVDFMGGSIGVESQVGKGSRFWFKVPFTTVAEMSQPVMQKAEKSPAPSLPLPVGTRILVVDDNRTNQQVARGMLERLECLVDVVGSGEDALEQVQQQHYHAVFMDIQMPGMDGYETTTHIRQQFADLPIIAMTANNQQSDIDRCLAVGMNDFLSKPFKLSGLHETLLRWVSADDVAATSPPPDAASADTIEPEPVSKPPPEPVLESDAGALIEQPTPPSTSAASAQVIDEDTLAELRQNAGSAFEEMIEVYLEDQQLYLEAIDKSLIEQDRMLLKRSAHTLKGSSRHFGAEELSEICRVLEDASNDAEFEQLAQHSSPLKAAAQAVRDVLSVRLQQIKHRHAEVSVEEVSVASENALLLVVDDDRSMRLTMCKVLEGNDYRIAECGDGVAAVEYCKTTMPDLILMDAIMPNMDGFSACRELRKLDDCKHTPILMVTALDDENSIDRAFSSGANDFIPKPVNFEVLRQRISRLLEASKAEKNVQHLSYNDTLTGLPNRRMFLEKLQTMLSQPRGEEYMVGLMFLDLDHFKLINDTLGHNVGDLLLKAVTTRIQDSLRSTDMVARLGGDEFTVILDHIQSAEIVGRIARKICEQLAQPFLLLEQQIYVTVSIGISIYPTDTHDLDTLIKYADTALYKAKEKRNYFQFYEAGMETLVAKRMELENEMRKALKDNEFVLHYQPQIDLQSNKILGMEALVRWQHPTRGMVSPAEFIPLAEETGLINALGEWVLWRACQQLQEWLGKGYPPLILSVNISSRQLEHPSFVEKVVEILDQTQVSADYLELEITETAIMQKPEEVIPTLEELKAQGVSLAIDDFGTGHSSLNYLRRFPVDTLKIDRSFVNDISTSTQDAVLINGIIALAKSLHLKVIAEGVETYEQKVYLRDHDCDWIQGFYMYKPMPAEVFEQQAFFESKATNF